MAGAPCPIEVMKRVNTEMHASEICIAYGMTETAPASFITRPDDDIERRVTTVGTVMPHVDAKIVDPIDGSTVTIGTPGEICTRGYLVMPGYWENPERHRGGDRRRRLDAHRRPRRDGRRGLREHRRAASRTW